MCHTLDGQQGPQPVRTVQQGLHFCKRQEVQAHGDGYHGHRDRGGRQRVLRSQCEKQFLSVSCVLFLRFRLEPTHREQRPGLKQPTMLEKYR